MPTPIRRNGLPLKGIYALEICLSRDVCLSVGALGKIDFRRGVYMYIGSGQRNLEQRVRRHCREDKKVFWHIDYLLNDRSARTMKVRIKRAGKPEECLVARELCRQGTRVVSFGCSDCRCGSHLFWFPEDFDLMGLKVLASANGWTLFEA